MRPLRLTLLLVCSMLPLLARAADNTLFVTTVPADDTTLISDGSSIQAVAVPNCPNDGAHGLVYSTSTNTIACASISTGSGGAPTTSTYVTTADETSTLTNSRRLVAGTNVTFNTATAGQLIVSASGGGISTPVSVANGGTNLTAATDDNLMVGDGTTWQSKTVGDCQDSGGNHLNYTASTNTISCGTSSGGSGGSPTFSFAAPNGAGSNQGNATALTNDFNSIITVASGAGVRLPSTTGGLVMVANFGANALSVYPPSGWAIDFLSTNAAYSIPAKSGNVYTRILFLKTGTTQYITIALTTS